MVEPACKECRHGRQACSECCGGGYGIFLTLISGGADAALFAMASGEKLAVVKEDAL